MKKRRTAASTSALNAPPALLNSRESVGLEMRSLSVGGASSFSTPRTTDGDFPLDAEEMDKDDGDDAPGSLLPHDVRQKAISLTVNIC